MPGYLDVIILFDQHYSLFCQIEIYLYSRVRIVATFRRPYSVLIDFIEDKVYLVYFPIILRFF